MYSGCGFQSTEWMRQRGAPFAASSSVKDSPVDGIVGPDTREALLRQDRPRRRRMAATSTTGTTAPDTEWEGEESLRSMGHARLVVGGVVPGRLTPASSGRLASIVADRSQQPAGPAAGLEGDRR